MKWVVVFCLGGLIGALRPPVVVKVNQCSKGVKSLVVETELSSGDKREWTIQEKEK